MTQKYICREDDGEMVDCEPMIDIQVGAPYSSEDESSIITLIIAIIITVAVAIWIYFVYINIAESIAPKIPDIYNRITGFKVILILSIIFGILIVIFSELDQAILWMIAIVASIVITVLMYIDIYWVIGIFLSEFGAPSAIILQLQAILWIGKATDIYYSVIRSAANFNK